MVNQYSHFGIEINHIDCMLYMKTLQQKSVDLVLTDIPYDVVNRSSGGLRNLDKEKADISTFNLTDFIYKICKLTKKSIYVFCSTEQCSEIRKIMIDCDLSTRHCIWEKTNPSPMNGEKMWLSSIENCIYGRRPNAIFTEHCKSSVWKYPHENNTVHPTQKPLNLFKYLIKTSTDVNDLVFDPCLGSGTTAIACKETQRRFIGCEQDLSYFKKAVKRINPFYFDKLEELK